MKKLLNRTQSWLIHLLGGYTEQELIHADITAERKGRVWMFHQLYHWCKGLEGKNPKKAWPSLVHWINEKYKFYY